MPQEEFLSRPSAAVSPARPPRPDEVRPRREFLSRPTAAVSPARPPRLDDVRPQKEFLSRTAAPGSPAPPPPPDEVRFPKEFLSRPSSRDPPPPPDESGNPCCPQNVANKVVNVFSTNECDERVEQHGEEVPATNADKILPVVKSQGGGFHTVATHKTVVFHLFEKRTCLTCNRPGQLLVCSEPTCPIAIHEECLTCKPQLDYLGNFYCPYCSYKRAVDKIHERSRKAMLRTEAFSTSFSLGTSVVYKRQKEQKSGEGEWKDLNFYPSPGHDSCRDDVSKQNNEGEDQADTSAASVHVHRSVVHEEGLQEGKSREATDNHCKEVQDQERPDTGDDHPSEEVVAEDAVRSKFYDGKRPRTGDLAADGVELRGKAPVEEAVTLRKGSSEPGISITNQKDSPDEKNRVTLAEKSRQQRQSPRNLPQPPLPDFKRRLAWSHEEEEILKEGVRLFSGEANKKIPWKKILEYGCRVFYPCRTPNALKHKWTIITSTI